VPGGGPTRPAVPEPAETSEPAAGAPGGGAGLVLVRVGAGALTDAAAAAGEDGWTVPYDSSWSGFVPERDLGSSGGEQLEEAARRVVPGERTGLAVWWGPEAAGFTLLVGSEPVCRHGWPGPRVDAERADALAIAVTDLLGVAGRRAEVAALLRRTGKPATLLAELVGLLTLPDVAVGAPAPRVRAAAEGRPGAQRVPGRGPASPAGVPPTGAVSTGAGSSGAPSRGAGSTGAGSTGAAPASAPSSGAAAFAAVLAVAALVLGTLRVVRWLQGDAGTLGGLLGFALLVLAAVEAATVARWLRARRRGAGPGGTGPGGTGSGGTGSGGGS